MGPVDAYIFNAIYVLTTGLDLDVFGPPQLWIRVVELILILVL
jgi:hypothetical protein